jgi:hypothetical protein
MITEARLAMPAKMLDILALLVEMEPTSILN